MALCYSAAWDARVVTSAWWVSHNQVRTHELRGLVCDCTASVPRWEVMSVGETLVCGTVPQGFALALQPQGAGWGGKR